ncbi:MAG: hypothetical protein DRP11_03070 [Candidatus Aenigmatarchaeota archaeon]|nr:MAG: hypothetical protein DRP11_03070 [Candidatus Aenigmarchaeota archaeon]
MKVIGLVGKIGSGKDTVSRMLKEYGFKEIGMGDMVREIARERGLEPTRENLQMIQKEFRGKYGPDYFAKMVVDRIRERGWERAVINGIRIPEDAEIPRKEFGKDFTLVLVEANPDIRFERLRKRRRPGDPKTFEEFQKQEEREMKLFNLEKTLSYADEIIYNNGTKEELKKEVDDLMKRLGFS